jgi:hypothetical protein
METWATDAKTGLQCGINDDGDLFLGDSRSGYNLKDTPDNRMKILKDFYKTSGVIKTPRGTFKVRAIFDSEREANESGYYIYFTNDDGTDVYTKHIGEYSCHFAIVIYGRRVGK